MGNKNGKGSNVIAIIIAIVLLLGLIGSCSGGSSSSSYQLHNKDGSINQQYYNDMQEYFAKHPEKRP